MFRISTQSISRRHIFAPSRSPPQAEDQPGQYSQILGGGHGLGVSVASNGSLVVVGARSEDEAQYLCEAVNEVGGGLSALVSLTVNGRLSPPGGRGGGEGGRA